MKPPGWLVRQFERGFDATLSGYTRSLDFALAHRDLVREVEINPLIVVDRAHDNLRAVDALIVFRPPGD